ncbi:hypothetical protein AU082_09915 [Yersinia pestis]|nr:hypothetical protein AU082_09915 [Yersinia pestis]
MFRHLATGREEVRFYGLRITPVFTVISEPEAGLNQAMAVRLKHPANAIYKLLGKWMPVPFVDPQAIGYWTLRR